VRDQLKRLEELQRHDAKIQELDTSLKAIPAKLEATRHDLSRVEILLASERASLAETEKYLTDQKDLISADESLVASGKHKLSQAKNSKEYMAAQREVETKRESITAREGEVAKLVEALDAKRKILEERGGEVNALRESIEKDAEVARAKMADLEGKLATLRAEREALVSGLRPDVVKRYSTIRLRRGLAVVAVKGGTCQGCNMNIPPQLYIQLQHGDSVETCPSCHRIVYWDELMKDDPAAASGDAPSSETSSPSGSPSPSPSSGGGESAA